jgi:hypothetical protein
LATPLGLKLSRLVRAMHMSFDDQQCQAHYRLVYIVNNNNNAKGEKSCQACYGQSGSRGLLAEGSISLNYRAAGPANGYRLRLRRTATNSSV